MTEPFILFTVAGTTYGLRSTQVAHVELIEHVTPVPNAAHFAAREDDAVVKWCRR